MRNQPISKFSSKIDPVWRSVIISPADFYEMAWGLSGSKSRDAAYRSKPDGGLDANLMVSFALQRPD
jgi:hypothetical protein